MDKHVSCERHPSAVPKWGPRDTHLVTTQSMDLLASPVSRRIHLSVSHRNIWTTVGAGLLFKFLQKVKNQRCLIFSFSWSKMPQSSIPKFTLKLRVEGRK